MSISRPENQVAQVGKFAGVGIINTFIDFGIFNVLSGSYVGLGLLVANIISTTIAMLFSFLANKRVVFEEGKGNVWVQGLIFFAVTAFGLYVLQNGIIFLLTVIFTAPLEMVYSIVKAIGLDGILSKSLVIKNSAKLIATLVSLIWNYLIYRNLVFKES